MSDGSKEQARKSIGSRRSPASAAAILDAATALLSEQGYAGFSIEAVARRARAGKPTIYRWWPSKAALLLDVYQRQKHVSDPDTGNLEEDLFQFLKSLFQHWRDTPSGSIFRSIIAEAQNDGMAAAALSEYSAERKAHTARVIERALARGELDADIQPALVADLVAAYAWLRLLTGNLNEDDETLMTSVRCLTRSVFAAPTPATRDSATTHQN